MLTILDTYDGGESYRRADLGDCDALLAVLDRASVIAPWIDIAYQKEIKEHDLQSFLKKTKAKQLLIAHQWVRIDLDGKWLYVSARLEDGSEFEEGHQVVEIPYNYSFTVPLHFIVPALTNFGPIVFFPTPGSIKFQHEFILWWRQGRNGEPAEHRMKAKLAGRPRRPILDSPQFAPSGENLLIEYIEE